jgi:hypothetical protein
MLTYLKSFFANVNTIDALVVRIMDGNCGDMTEADARAADALGTMTQRQSRRIGLSVLAFICVAVGVGYTISVLFGGSDSMWLCAGIALVVVAALTGFACANSTAQTNYLRSLLQPVAEIPYAIESLERLLRTSSEVRALRNVIVNRGGPIRKCHMRAMEAMSDRLLMRQIEAARLEQIRKTHTSTN